MGCLKKEENNIVVCEHCSKGDVDLTFFKTDVGMPHFYCKECVIEQYLMLCPIQFDREFIKIFFEQFTKHDKEKESNISKLYDFLKPFLESK